MASADEVNVISSETHEGHPIVISSGTNGVSEVEKSQSRGFVGKKEHMMRTQAMKKIGAFVLTLALATAFIPAAFATSAPAGNQDAPLVAQEGAVATGPQAYGDLIWEIDTDGKLSIWPADGKSGTLSIGGNAPWQAQASSITSVDIADGILAANLSGMFRGCSSLVTVDLSNLDTSELSGMDTMFSACTSLLLVDLSGFDTSNVSMMGGMFSGCSSLVAIDLSSFDTQGAFKMQGMFSGCTSLVKVSLGENFRFTSDTAYLPEGEWQSATTGATYSAEQVAISQQGIADTYTNLTAEVEAPTITDGADASWTKGSKDGITLRSNANILLFEDVKVDGTPVDAANYDVTEGSTLVSLKPGYLQTLAEGEHAIDIASITGTASTKLTVAPDPTTVKPDNPKPSEPDKPKPSEPDKPDNPKPSEPDTPNVPDDPTPEQPEIWGQSMYRLYNPNSGEHFYTSSVVERNDLMWRGWKAEGIAWTAPSWGTPVYRLYNPNAGEHHYTTSEIERAVLIYAGWNDEGIGWYGDTNQAVPVYRVYNPNAYANNHHYTTDWGERDVLVDMGWRDEGVGWHGIN